MHIAARSLGIELNLGPAAIVGDITPNDGISKEEKRRLEANAIVRIQEMLGPGSAAGPSYLCTACSLHSNTATEKLRATD